MTTSTTVKLAMLRDLGSRDDEFIKLIADIRSKLLEIAGVSKKDGYEAVLIPGSGTYAIESVLSSTTPLEGKLLIAVNGAYGRRMVEIIRRYVIDCTVVTFPENEPVSIERLEKELSQDRWIQQVAVVHCETTTGILNPISDIAKLCKRHRKQLIVDSMSAFGGIPIDLKTTPVDFLVSSSNKCLEGVPGFSYVLGRREALEAADGLARTMSLDLVAQWKAMEGNGQFRFTPPTHTLLAFAQALRELEDEGGVKARHARYTENHKRISAGMRQMGFHEYVAKQHQSPIISTFLCPQHPRFEFEDFYRRLHEKGFVIYPGKLTHEDCFRIGSIGRIGTKEVDGLLKAVTAVLKEMQVDPRSIEPLEDD